MSLFTRESATRNGPSVEEDDSSPEDEKTVRLVRKRFARRQWTRRWLAWWKLVLAVVLLALLLTAGWLVFFSPVLAVNGVRVEGTRVVPSGAVRRAADVPLGTPLATVDLDAITARVKRLPAVKSVDVSRAWPDRVRVDVTERRAVAVVEPQQADAPGRGVDSEGVLFRHFAHPPRGLPMIRMGQGVGSDALTEAARVAGSMPSTLAHKVAFIEVRTVDTILLVLHSGRTVRWGSADGSVDKARVLAVLLRQKASFYDVSVPGQPVIKR